MRALLIFVCCSVASAAEKSGRGFVVPVHFDIEAGVGYTKADSVTLAQAQVGATAGFLIGKTFILGATTDYRFLTQQSAVSAEAGNLRGTRWNVVSPTVGFYLGRFLLKFDYQLLGNYVLTNRTVSGATLSYRNPRGWRLTGAYPLLRKLHVSAFYESLSFSTLENSTSGVSTISTALKLWQVGLGTAYVF